MGLLSALRTPLFVAASFVPPLCYALLEVKNRRALVRYYADPQPIRAPNPIKRLVILEAFVRTGQEVFVETGTYYGETTRMLARVARKVHTIELSATHYYASKRIMGASNVEMTLGDSRVFLETVTPTLRGRLCFFLDAHPTNPETTPEGAIDIPIMEELRIVHANPDTSLIIIDDAIGGEGYPSIDAVRAWAGQNGYGFGISHNMMFLEKGAA